MKKPFLVNAVCQAFLSAGRRCISLLMLLYVLGILSVDAQNNVYKIRDDLYELYVRAYRLRNTPEGLAMADTLYTKAVKVGDKKAQCIAAVIPLSYYMYNNESTHLEAAVERCKAVARANGYMQYYYHADSQLITYYLNSGYSMRALRKTEDVKEEAIADNDAYGICISIRSLGNIYFSRSNFKEAGRCYQEALDYMLKNLPEQDPSQLYTNIARCLLYALESGKDRTQTIDSVVYMCDRALQIAKTERTYTEALLVKCHACFKAKDMVNFKQLYEECLKEEAHIVSMPGGLYLDLVKIDKAILDGDKERAYAHAREMTTPIDRYQQSYLIAKKFGDYDKALAYHERARELSDSLMMELQLQDLAELTAQTDNARLRQENMQLDLQNTTLSLERTRQQMELERRDAENNRLLLDNRELELQQLQNEADLQQKEMENAEARLQQQQEKSHYRLILFTVVVVSLVIFIIFLVMFLYRRRRNIRLLREKNRELSEARDEAQSANRMKTAFIQNMSHEIRTPLNAIVGFSQIITDPNLELKANDAQEYGQLIQHNSKLLTTLVNDLLGLAELESGKYTVRLSAQPCNQLCHEAVSTVLYRNPKQVRLYWTSEVSDDYTLLTDGTRLRQVLINFLTNAEKHTTEGEIHLHCSVSEHPGKVTFSVTDTGTGVPPEQAERIFNRFEKLDNFRQGLGLGLNICRLIAANLHGTVMLDTSYTGGARFLFILPVEYPDTQIKDEA